MNKFLISAYAAFLLFSCAANDAPVTLENTNMGDVTFGYDGLIEGERASFLGKEVEDDHYPIFYNGSVLDADLAFYYDGVTEPYIDLGGFLNAICDFTEITGENEVTVRYAVQLDGNEVIHDNDLTVIKLTHDSDTASVDGEQAALSAPVSIADDGTVMLPYSDAAIILGLETYFYGSEDADAWVRDPDTRVVEQSNGAPYYISGTPHLMFWNYPDGAKAMTKEEAVDAAREILIQAYEYNFGTYEPLTEAECEELGGWEGYNNPKIQNLTVTSENDRFYRIPYVYDFLVDKYTGDVITQYNGISEVFRRYDPLVKGSLAFAG